MFKQKNFLEYLGMEGGATGKKNNVTHLSYKIIENNFRD
jgi:hypothetical protein